MGTSIESVRAARSVMVQVEARGLIQTSAYGQRPIGLVRSRLLAALDGPRRHRLGLVVAPAGSGKTTLLTQYARAFDGPVWWHVVEAGDASATTFCRRMAATLQVEDLADLLRSAGTGGGLLVIDDLHRVAQTPAEAALGDFLARSPTWLNVIVGSRAMPSFNLSQYELSDVAVVDAEQLRFRAWEVECLLRDVYGEPLPPDDAATLSRRVGGWAAGLHMFHLSTAGRPLAERRHALAALDGRSRRTRDYLAATVLAELPEPTREFLVLTCVFDRVTAERCVCLLGDRITGDVQWMLADLERRQAFTTSDDGGVSFRYHEVLRAHLKVMLMERLGERGARDWYARAGALLEADGYGSEAVRAYARAEDWNAVRRLVAGLGAEVADDFAQWRDVLPAWLVVEDPWLVLAEGRYWLSRGRIARAVDLFRQAEALAQDRSVQLTCRLARGRASVWLPNGASETAPPLPADHPLSQLRAATQRHLLSQVEPIHRGSASDDAATLTALAATAGQLFGGDVGAARRTVDCAVGHLQIDDAPAALALRIVQVAMQLAAGEPGADDRLARVSALAERAQSPWLTRMARAASAFDGTESGLKEAYATAEDCARDGDSWGTILAESAAMLARVLAGDPDVGGLRRLSERCAALDASVLAAWADAYAACLDDGTGPDQGTGVDQGAVVGREPSRSAATPGTSALVLVAAARQQGTARALGRARAAAAAAGLPAAHVEVLLGPTASAPTTAVDDRIRVRCFGGFSMVLPGRTLDWTAIKPRTRAALRLLAMHGGRPVHREVLAAALWPEMDSATATRNLHVTLSSLRTFLDPGTPRGRCSLIVRTGDAYELALPAGGELDVVAFTNALAVARSAHASHDSLGGVAALRTALSVYAGELLPEDGPAEWVTAARDAYRQQAAAAAELLAAAELDAGDAARALAAAERCLEIDVYRDRGWRLLADAHRRLGNHAAADRASRDYAAMLASLGLDPRGAPLRSPTTVAAPVSSGRSTPLRPRQPGDPEPSHTPFGSSPGPIPRSQP